MTASLRVPQENGSYLFHPSLESVPGLVADNQARLRSQAGSLLGRPWPELRRLARQELLHLAIDYLRDHGQPPSPSSPAADTILLAGHQPELFHPGVWLKHFVLGRLAQKLGGTAVHLIVDSDAVRSWSLDLPDISVPLPPLHDARPRLLSVPFAPPAPGVPYEDWLLEDRELFASLPARAATNWGFTPLLGEFWRLVMEHEAACLGERFAAARRAMERRWGCENLEVPISALCQSESFAWFAASILADLPRFFHIHQRRLQEYRARHGLKSHTHPVPDLTANGDWIEAPFWAWREGQQRRQRLFVRRVVGGLELRVGQEIWPTLPPEGGRDLASSIRGLEREGFKIRPRALSNTLFARLFLGDLFVHGIGGGKYDELTDDLARDFFGLEPPAYLIVSGTLLLPMPSYPARVEDYRRLVWTARDLEMNPQRNLREEGLIDPIVAHFAEQKQQWIRRQPTSRAERRQRGQTLRQLTRALAPALAGRRELVRRQAEVCLRQLQANDLLRRRDYAFCLHPETTLRPFLTRWSG